MDLFDNKNDIITLDLSSHVVDVPLGMLLAPGRSNSSPTTSNVTLLAGWEHDDNGQHLGPIQRSGLVRLGDRLVRINSRDVTDWTFREVMDALKELASTASSNTLFVRHSRVRTLGFARSGTVEWSRGTVDQYSVNALSESAFVGLLHQLNPLHPNQSEENEGHVVHSKRTYTFVSFIGGWRVAREDTHNENAQKYAIDQDITITPSENQNLPENSDELERQLNKQPSIRYNDAVELNDGEDEAVGEPSLSAPAQDRQAPTSSKSYVQYEIQCRLLFRDHTSFSKTSSSSKSHYSWSIWKRFSEFSTLDDELRPTFGWQMDAYNNGRGILFPSQRGIACWWYSLRNGGGVLTSLIGNSGALADGAAETDANSEAVKNEEKEEGSWTRSLYGLLQMQPNSEKSAISFGTRSSCASTTSICPYPTKFITTRRKELATYWKQLMVLEDIFEFSDINSHNYGAAMARFLNIDGTLVVHNKRGSNPNLPLSNSGESFQPILENEVSMFGMHRVASGQMPSSTRQMPGVTTHDDDVSLLSDGTGNYGHHQMPKAIRSPGRLVVDVLPNDYSGEGSNEVQQESKPTRSTSGRSISGASVSSSSTRRRMGNAPKAKPAFQRRQLDLS